MEFYDTISIKDLEKLSGPIGVPLTNDYLFRALLQFDNQVLKSLICALLYLDPDEVRNVTIVNPVEIGKHIDDKDFILDIKAELDNHSIINLEMQVIHYKNWVDRSLNYLCREFDNLNVGEDYLATKTIHQIGLLDFTLFEDEPEFYANFYLMNEKTHRIYSDKLHLAVLDLTRVDIATEQNLAYHLDMWARFFKCKNWSDVTMLAKQNEDIANAAGTIYRLTQDEMVRQQCQAREDFYKQERTTRKIISNLEQEKSSLEREKSSLEQEKSSLEQERIGLQQENNMVRQENQELKKEMEMLRRQLETLRK